MIDVPRTADFTKKFKRNPGNPIHFPYFWRYLKFLTSQSSMTKQEVDGSVHAKNQFDLSSHFDTIRVCDRHGHGHRAIVSTTHAQHHVGKNPMELPDQWAGLTLSLFTTRGRGNNHNQ